MFAHEMTDTYLISGHEAGFPVYMRLGLSLAPGNVACLTSLCIFLVFLLVPHPTRIRRPALWDLGKGEPSIK